MKNAPLTRGVRISKSCFRLQQEETTTPTDSGKLEEGRPERFPQMTFRTVFILREIWPHSFFHINRRTSHETYA